MTSGSISFNSTNVNVGIPQFNVVGPATLNINADTTLPNLYLTGSSAALAADLTLTGTSQLASSQVSGAHSLLIDSSGLVNVTGTITVYTSFSNSGVLVVSGAGSIHSAGSFVNQQSGLVELQGTSLAGTSAGVPPFTNNGTVTASAGFQIIGLPVVNAGNFTVLSGTVTAQNAFNMPATTVLLTNKGFLTVDSGATLSVSGGVYEQAAGATMVLGTLSSNETVNVQGGLLDGTGTIGGNLSNSGTVSPGDPDGILTVTGNYTQLAAGALAIEPSGIVAGTDYGQLLVDGSVALNGTMHVTPQYAAVPGDSYLVLTQNTTNAVHGTLVGVPEGGLLDDGPNVYRVSYVAGSTANDVLLTAMTYNQSGIPAPPQFSITNVNLLQATAGTVNYTFTVTLDQVETIPVSVNYSTQNVTAIAGQDYLPTQGTLTFLPGQATQTITVHVLGNPAPEPTKRFQVVLTNPAQPLMTEAVGLGTIQGTLSTTNLTSTGTDFWLAFPQSPFDIGQFFEGISQTPVLDVLISSTQAATGTISIAGISFQQNWTVAAGGVTDILIPSSAEVTTNDGIQNLGIHVVSNSNPVSVTAIVHKPASSDAISAIATPALGTTYRVLAYKNDGAYNGSRYTIIATTDNTTLTLTAGPYSLQPMPATITLNAGQVFQFDDQDSGGDVTGTLIQSNQPIVVIGGSLGTDIPAGTAAANVIMEEMPPTDDWGTYFVTTPFDTRDGDTFRVLANQNGTIVQINGQVVATLNAGSYYETVLTQGSLITSNNPVLVGQFSNSSSFDHVTGDPFEDVVAPIDEFARSYTFGVKSYADNTTNPDAAEFTENFINLVVPISAIGQVEMNGVPISASLFTVVPNSGYADAEIPVANGTPAAVYTFTTSAGNVKFGANQYAFATYDGYGTVGSYGNDSAPYAVSLGLTPATDSPDVGTEASVTATVLGPNQVPVIGGAVTFVITGANPQTTVLYTNGQGQATLTYLGTAAGADNIQAFVTSNGQALTATATKTWVQVTPTIQINSPSNGTQFAEGTTVLVSGTATPGAPGVPIVGVTVNGQPVEVLDAAGDFFTHVTLPDGSTTLTFVATDSLGDTASTTLTLSGVTPAVASATDANLIPGASFVGTYYRTSFDELTKVLYADLTLENSGQYPLETPLYVAVKNISNPTVLLRNYDGVLADGTPYYNLTALLSGSQFSPGDSTQTTTLQFYNPNQIQFTYTLELVGGVDPGPRFQSAPAVNTAVGLTYSYQTAVADTPGDTLTYSLVAGPSGMTISSAGLVTWTPSAGQQGTYSITLAVSNQFGDQALQHYILTVGNAPPNLPPLFTSTPTRHRLRADVLPVCGNRQRRRR